ncbi:hypothetical protein J6590_009306 [Homalodisca vitripennis]|nr:hypothetical protein J6590_009306 [Homalodisca vitripennis]
MLNEISGTRSAVPGPDILQLDPQWVQQKTDVSLKSGQPYGSLPANVEILGRKGNFLGLVYCGRCLLELHRNKGVPPPTCLDWRCLFGASFSFLGDTRLVP